MTCGYRYRENKGAYYVGWVFGVILIFILIFSLLSNGNGSKSDAGESTAETGARPSSNNSQPSGGGIFGIFIFLIIIMILFNSSTVYYKYDDDCNGGCNCGCNGGSNGDDVVVSYDQDGYVLMVFGANWCGYTNKFLNELSDMDEFRQTNTSFPCYVESIECEQGSSTCPTDIAGFPTSYLVDSNGDIVQVYQGYSPAQDMFNKINNDISSYSGNGSASNVSLSTQNIVKEAYGNIRKK